MKVTDNSTYRLMQTNLDRITNDLLTLRTQGSTGLKLNTSSDDPGAIRPVLTTRSQLQQNNRFLETMGQAGDKMAAADGHLAQVENVLVRVKELAINAINSSLSSTDLATLADEIAQMRNELADTANAVVDGKYIFAGYEEDTRPFVANENYSPDDYDPTDPDTWPYLYQGDNNPTTLEITPGEYLAVNLTGRELFLGIANDSTATSPHQGQTVLTGPLLPGSVTGDITLTSAGGAPVPITALELNSQSGSNYAADVAALFNQPGTGVTATPQAATVDLGALDFSQFVAGADTYSLNITAGASSVSVTLDGPPPAQNFDFSLEGLAAAFAADPGTTNPTATGGTLANGVSYDTSGGSLLLTGPADGAEIALAETITGVAPPLPANVIADGDQTVYGTVSIAPHSTTEVAIDGAGLADLGLTAETLGGATKIDLFSVLTRLEEAVRAGNFHDPTGPGGSIQAQLGNIDIAADQNRGLRSSLGAKAQRVETAIFHQEDARVDLRQILSRYQDADMIEVFNDIVQKETAFQAALNISGRVSQISILDYF